MTNGGFGALAALLVLLLAAVYVIHPWNQPSWGGGLAQTSTPTLPVALTRTQTPAPPPARTATIGPFPTRLPGFSGSNNNASKYHPLIWPNSTARWAHMPLKVFLNTTKEKYLADYRRAAETWEAGTGGVVSFVLTNSSEEADIAFIWVETVISDEGNRLGWTEPLAINAGDFYMIKHATITMRVEAGPCDADTSIINVLAHELGHALGLGHETRYNDDLMKEQLKCQFYALPAISENAKLALAELYRIQKINSG